MNMKKLSVTELRLVQTDIELDAPESISDLWEAARLFEKAFDMSNQAQELFCAIFMDELSHIVGIEKIVAGSAKEFTGSNHELFKRCLLHNATRMILCHNHVTRNAQPSFEDLELTWNIIQTGLPLGVSVEEHLVISERKFFPIVSAFAWGRYSPEKDVSGEGLKEIYKRIESLPSSSIDG